MDIDKVLTELSEANQDSASDAVVSKDEKNVRASSVVSKGFIESAIGKLNDKVGKDVKARIGIMRSRLSAEDLINVLVEIMNAGNMTKLVTLKDVPSLNKKGE